MLLSPTVKVGSDHCSRTVAPLFQHCYNYHPFYIFALSPTLTPVGDPLHYKRRPEHNVEGVRLIERSKPRPLIRSVWLVLQAPELSNSILTSSSRVLRIRAA